MGALVSCSSAYRNSLQIPSKEIQTPDVENPGGGSWSCWAEHGHSTRLEQDLGGIIEATKLSLVAHLQLLYHCPWRR